MHQVLQDLKSGSVIVEDVPAPACRAGHVVIATRVSLISAGTERMLMEFGRGNLIEKARQQPDKVRQVLEKVRTDGLWPTIEAVRAKLDQPLPLGYSSVGTVVEVADDVSEFDVGDRVASNGHHAGLVCVPKHLCARVPDGVEDGAAAFTVVSAIALQGIRLIQPTLGETIAVTGLGLIGLLTVQLLRTHGCRVIGIDFDRARLARARELGAETVDLKAGEDPVQKAMTISRGRGVDGVIITASTRSNEPVHQAAAMSRKRGRIVLVGVVGLELSRADFFEKELTFQVSCSYGPGRYDSSYELKGQDYPIGFVRWTEQRNFEAILDMMAGGQFDPRPLITHRYEIANAHDAYAALDDAASLGILLRYETPTTDRVVARPVAPAGARDGVAAPRLAFIGSGNYATRSLMPAAKRAGAVLASVSSNSGVSATHAAKKFGFAAVTSDAAAAIASSETDAVVVATPHSTHARYVIQALRAGKPVFVEKPLAISMAEIDSIEMESNNGRSSPPVVMVGFNRRFSPLAVKMRELLASVSEPKTFVVTVNAGEIPATHWTQDAAVGGGRIVGEACHFIDLLRFLSGAPIASVAASGLTTNASTPTDTAAITLRFADGSLGTIHYIATGHRSFPKERIEAFAGGRILQLDNFRTMTGYGWPSFSRQRLFSQDKGNDACFAAFVNSVRDGGPSPIPFDELLEISRATVEAAELLRMR